jgi:ATP-binding cassette subfamily B (MDR/TAP) protein 1
LQLFTGLGLIRDRRTQCASRGQHSLIKSYSPRYALAFVGIAAGAGITIAIKFYFLGLAGERLTERLRTKVFGVLVRQEVSYYDMPENSRGTLTSHLSTDAAAVRGILGDRLALAVQSVALIAGGCAVAFYFCPKVGAVVLGASPMIALGGEGWGVSRRL